jgi:hypothetical protein
VPIIENDHVVEAFSSNRSNHAFAVRILPCYLSRHSGVFRASSRHRLVGDSKIQRKSGGIFSVKT